MASASNTHWEGIKQKYSSKLMYCKHTQTKRGLKDNVREDIGNVSVEQSFSSILTLFTMLALAISSNSIKTSGNIL